MNQHLQNILYLIQQDKNISEEEKNAVIKSLKDANKELEITAFKLDRTEKVKRTTAILLEETIEELEHKRKAIEAQNKELEIESSLERVRTVALSMTGRDDMLFVCRMISEQLEVLHVKDIRNVQTAIFYEERGTYMNYEYYAKHDKTFVTETIYTNHQIAEAFAAKMMKGKGEISVTLIEGEEKVKEWLAYQKATNVFIDTFLETASSLNYYWFSLGPVALGISTYVALSDDVLSLFKRFLNVFELAYRRYLDIEKAAAQAHEVQIELALERVRARTMAMQHSDELSKTAAEMFRQIQLLGLKTRSCGFNIIDRENSLVKQWVSTGDGRILPAFETPSDEDVFERFTLAAEKDKSLYVEEMGGELLRAHYQYMSSLPEVKKLPDEFEVLNITPPDFQVFHLASFSCGYLMFITYQPAPEFYDIFKRFATVFDQTYRRFLDLQNAEAQTRESQIQLALERVRGRSLAMHQSTELKDVVAILFQQLKILEVGFDGGAAIHLFKEDSKDAVILVAAPDLELPIQVNLPYDADAFTNNPVILDVWKAKDTGKNILNRLYSFEEKNKYFDYVFKHNNLEIIPRPARDFIRQAKNYTASFIAEKNSLLGANSWSGQTFSEYDFDILKRIAKVFEQAYVRFLDLQKAEAQAKENQVQLALERVRARTMAMQKSNELTDVAAVLFKQVNELGIKPWTTGFNVWSDDNNSYEDYVTSPQGGFIEAYVIDATKFSVFMEVSRAKKEGKEFFVQFVEGELLKETYRQLGVFANKNQFGKILEEGFQFPSKQIDHFVFGSKVSLMFITYEPVPEAHDIFKRFGKVFDQTYTRFLDLQKAEAQAREATIEAALERVRASAMAMHSSEGFLEITQVLREQVALLGEKKLESIIIHIYNEEADSFEAWYTYRNPEDPGGKITDGKNVVNWSRTARAASDKEKYHSKETDYTIVADRNMLTEWYNYLKEASPEVVDLDHEGNILVPEILYYNYAKFHGGALLLITNSEASEESKRLLRRSAKVFDLAFTRFLDLQKAEGQAKEAKIETALERVRSRTLAMQRSEELTETAAVLFKQLILLGIEPNRLYINIIKNERGQAEFWITDEDGSKVSTPFELNLNDNPSFKKMHEGWQEKKKSMMLDMQGEGLEEYFQYLGSLHVPFKHGLLQKRRLQYIAYFNKGFIGMASPDEQPEETVTLLERFAAVFNLTFTRFNDLKVAEAHAVQAKEDLVKLQTEKRRAEDALNELQVTQRQLIQAEKMASLGELTAGIAHEIQNPLNFVNNFSEVSKELLDEMKAALESGDKENAKEIADDIIQNLDRINHHGKRADAIVKGMLLHSGKNNGQKEPTDINALCGEYLRLSYHGLRAKDKSFNANFETDLDDSIGKINIVQQSIGRALLNLCNNAFYAVNEKAKLSGNSYQPTAKVITRKLNDKVEIRVEDNGNGIPSNIINKIFQPFFTTRPTGQGTGLGLSLVYDIISKEHNGMIKVESKEGVGATFIINLAVD